MSTPDLNTTFEFLSQLVENNHREWFQANKHVYEQAHAGVIAFADELLEAMHGHDQISTLTGKKSLYRIYRDVRFSKNKTPYKSYWDGYLRRDTDRLRGGYYFLLKPGGGSYLAGGFFGPNSADLLRVRQEIDADHEELQAILDAPGIRNTFGKLDGRKVKTAPRGFRKDHPGIELLRLKNYEIAMHFH